MKPGANNERVYRMAFASVYPHYVTKVERKGRTKEELHTIINWLTGYTEKGLQKALDTKVDFETFFAKAPRMHPNVAMITGMIPLCGTGPAATASRRSRTRSCGRYATWTSWPRAGRWRRSCGSERAVPFLLSGHLLECIAIWLPSVSTKKAMKPFGPMPVLGMVTLPPAFSTRPRASLRSGSAFR